MNQTVQKMMRLIKSAITDTEIEEKDFTLSGEEFRDICYLAKINDFSQIIDRALQKNKIEAEKIDKESAAKLKDKTFIAISRYEQIIYEAEALQNIFESEKIPYMFLKGAHIRQYYPEPWMRTSCDVDILVQRNMIDKAVSVLEKNGYKKDVFTYHDILLIAPSDVHIELHYQIKEGMKKADKLLSKTWDYSEPVEDGKYMYRLDKEFFMFSLFVHTAKHFWNGGCGIKPFVDLYLLEKNVSFNKEKLDALLEKGGMKVFAEKMRALTYHWLDGGELSELELKMEDFILLGGMYGNDTNVTMMEMQKSKNFSYFWKRIFLPYESLKTQYPIIIKHPILTPFCSIARIVTIIFGGKLAKKTGDAKNILKNHEDRNLNVKEMLEQLEL